MRCVAYASGVGVLEGAHDAAAPDATAVAVVPCSGAAER